MWQDGSLCVQAGVTIHCWNVVAFTQLQFVLPKTVSGITALTFLVCLWQSDSVPFLLMWKCSNLLHSNLDPCQVLRWTRPLTQYHQKLRCSVGSNLYPQASSFTSKRLGFFAGWSSISFRFFAISLTKFKVVPFLLLLQSIVSTNDGLLSTLQSIMSIYSNSSRHPVQIGLTWRRR